MRSASVLEEVSGLDSLLWDEMPSETPMTVGMAAMARRPRTMTGYRLEVMGVVLRGHGNNDG